MTNHVNQRTIAAHLRPATPDLLPAAVRADPRGGRELKWRPMELTKLREWFLAFDVKNWDRQFKADVAAGRLDDLAREAIRDTANAYLRTRTNGPVVGLRSS